MTLQPRTTSGRVLPFRKGRAGNAAPGSAVKASGAGSLVGESPSGTATSSRPFAASRFRDLIVPHIDAAYSLARYLARDPVAAEDIAQEALLKAFRHIESVRGEAKPWLMTIVRNTYFDWRRGAGADAAIGGEAAEAALADTSDPAEEGAEAALIRAGDIAALRAAIEAIPEPFREALVLRDIEELSYREVAEVTGAPVGTVMSRLSRARRMLGERMGVMEAAP